MEVDCLVLGDFATNCYVVRANDQAKKCFVIDPGFSAEKLSAFLRKKGYAPERILLTHGHCDHIAGVGLLQNDFGPMPVGIGQGDANMLSDAMLNLSAMMGMQLGLPPAEDEYVEDDMIIFEGIELKVIATPGHTPGGISFWCPDNNAVFTGDTLFAGGIGRSDFPGGNQGILLEMIRSKLYVLPESSTVYSGHGPETTIVAEKRTNPFVQG